MSSPRAKPTPVAHRRSISGWMQGGLILLFWIFVAAAAVKAGRHLLELSRTSDFAAADPVISAASPTGYQNGLRRMFLGGHDDAYQWIMQAEATAAGKGLRIRHVDYDNAPQGREVHWAMPHRLWLLALGYAVHLIEGVPVGLGIERAVLFDGPLLYGLFGAVLIGLAARQYSLRTALLVTLGLVGCWPLSRYFAAGEADHHGMIAALSILMLVTLHLGLRATGSARPFRTDETARPGPDAGWGWMIAAGISGGFGLWLSASSVVPVLAGVGLGAAAGRWFQAAASPALRAKQWRTWGRAGAATSVACYLLEYFPGHMALRLEVNHPAYALAWLGAAECLALWFERSERGATPAPGNPRRWILAAAAVLVLPVAFLVTRQNSFWIGDQLAWNLHRDYIEEFLPLAKYLGANGLSVALACAALALIAPAVLSIQWLRGRIGAEAAQRLLVLLAPTLLLGIMAAMQVRWLGAVFAANLCLLIAWHHEAGESAPLANSRRHKWTALLPFVLVLPGCVQALLALAEPDPAFTRRDLARLAERSVAYRLQQRIGDGVDAIVLTTPAVTNAFGYFAGLRGVGTLYWENLPGLRKAAAIYAAPSFEAAHRLIVENGITHVVAVSWDGFEAAYVRLADGRSPAEPVREDAFIFRLLSRQNLPDWLRPVPYRLPDHPAYAGDAVLIFEVVEGQAADLKLVDEIECLLESGETRAAEAREGELRSMAQSVPALTTLGRVIGVQRAEREILPQIERRISFDPPLRLADRLRLALLAAQSGRIELARQELILGYEQVDVAALRKLSPETLSTLIRLADALKIPFPDPALRETAVSFLPPYLK